MTSRRFLHEIIKIVVLIIAIPLLSHGQAKEKANGAKSIGGQIDSLRMVIQSNHKEMQDILDSISAAQNTEIKKQQQQNDKIDELLTSSNNPSFNVNKDLLYPFILSMFSALLFWLVFSFWPERTRRNKLRPKLELDMYHVYMDLFGAFDKVMSIRKHSPSSYQDKIKGQGLTIEDINLGLQNKCLNETYLYDSNINAIQLPIGLSLKHAAEKIDKTIDKIFDFSEYLSPEEILLLENILKKFQVYSYTSNADSEIGGIKLYPVNPSLAYMTNNLFELYQLFGQLEKVVQGNKLRDRNISIQMIQFLYHSGQFVKCIKEAKGLIKKHPKDKVFLEFYIVRSLYKSSQRKLAYAGLEKLLEAKPHLVSNRGFLEELLGDERVIEILNKKYTEAEIDELRQVLLGEKTLKDKFEENGRKLKQYYIEKSEANAKRNQTKTES